MVGLCMNAASLTCSSTSAHTRPSLEASYFLFRLSTLFEKTLYNKNRQLLYACPGYDPNLPEFRARLVAREVDDLDCILCLKLLFEPVTTPCGHSFCRPCFARALDHGNKCPCCRTVRRPPAM